ncbi:DUF2303 family protein [Streptomyces odonnellii]|uniref:DUF2303 family protein n=1 Tax=Streptomyces odonnellii TaxID=1417980 RepID=UPI0006258670|nr:DUF2303 family protein [Streptomyces odonnellii]
MPVLTYDTGLPLPDQRNVAQAVVDVALRSARPAELTPGKVYSLVTPDGKAHQLDLTGPKFTGVPPRKTGTTTVRDVDSFLAYFDKHGDFDSEVYADVERHTITAVLDAHQSDAPRWSEHRLHLSLRPTAAWRAWMGIDDRLMPQGDFAEFIEDNLVDLVEPDSATMLELAESFQATTSAEFQSSQRLDSGQRRFSYVEDVQAKAGHRGDITIPGTLTLALRPFEGSEPYRVIARFKYRLSKEGLRLGIKIERPGDVLAAAFEDIRTLVDNGIPEEIAVLNGSPLH